MTFKIQGALGKNAKLGKPLFEFSKETYSSIGQVVISSVKKYLDNYLTLDDGSSLVSSIYSKNLNESARFSARSARIAYLLGKVSFLGAVDRKGVVRTQIIEYGAVCEAILLDLIQSVGVQDNPKNCRPIFDAANCLINWAGGGLFSVYSNNQQAMRYRFDFKWLIKEAARLGVVDHNLYKRISWLRKSRNLVHPVIPTSQRYRDDVHSSRAARDIVIALRDVVIAYKKNHGLP